MSEQTFERLEDRVGSSKSTAINPCASSISGFDQSQNFTVAPGSLFLTAITVIAVIFIVFGILGLLSIRTSNCTSICTSIIAVAFSFVLMPPELSHEPSMACLNAMQDTKYIALGVACWIPDKVS